MIEAQERHEKSPKKVISHMARCGSSGGLLIWFKYSETDFFFFSSFSLLESIKDLYLIPIGAFWNCIPNIVKHRLRVWIQY